MNQERVARQHYEGVAVYGWVDKAEERGCGVVFGLDGSGAWALFAQTLDHLNAAPGDWEPVSGQRWGFDSPEGEIPESSNVNLDADGTLNPP